MPAHEEDETSEVDDETLARLERLDVGLPPAPVASNGGMPSLEALRAGLAAALSEDSAKKCGPMVQVSGESCVQRDPTEIESDEKP